MNYTELEIPGLILFKNYNFHDNRGTFTKTFSEMAFLEIPNINLDFKEIYYTISRNNTIRGMHFQLPPADHAKLIYLVKGKIIDLILDIRKTSKTFGKYVELELNTNEESLYIPSGCAHGFRALEDDTIVIYNQTSNYNPELDSGINYTSFGYNWCIAEPIISERDRQLPNFKEFNSPF